MEKLSSKYPISFLCKIMRVNRSGFYKWKSRQTSKNQYEKDRETLGELLKDIHKKYPSYGYRRLASVIRKSTGWLFSDNLAHKCCKFLNIKSQAKHYRYVPYKINREHIKFKNIVNNNWNASKPLEIIVSDMTCIFHKGLRYEWTYLLDTFNNEIISSHVSSKQGDNQPYFKCLEDLKTKIRNLNYSTILHTDQGAVYSSRAFQYSHRDNNIVRSMSRVGTPTDNPIIESINGWIKEEMKVDFQYQKEKDIFKFIKKYVKYYNEERPAYSLNYKSPIQYKIELGF